MRQEAYDMYIAPDGASHSTTAHAFAANVLITSKNVRIVDNLANLYAHLLENHYIDSIVGFDSAILGIFSRDVLRRIKEKDPSWETMVPAPVVEAIKRRGLFGYSENPIFDGSK